MATPTRVGEVQTDRETDMIVKYAQTPLYDEDDPRAGPVEYVWVDRIARVVQMGVTKEVTFPSNYRENHMVGDAPWRCYMLIREDNQCDIVGFGINARIQAFLLSDEGKTIDRL